MYNKTGKFTSLLIVLFIVIGGFGNMAMAQSDLKTRDQVADKYKWNLADVYNSEAEWNKEFDYVSGKLGEYAKYQGKLDNPKAIAECYKLHFDLLQRLNKLYIYSALGKDTDLKNAKFQGMYEKVSKLGSEVSAASAFVTPEITSIPKAKMDGFIKSDELKDYKQLLENMFRTKEHTLSAKEEQILAKFSQVTSVPTSAYNILNDAELPFPVIKDENGKDVRLSHGRYRSGLYSNDRAYRERVYKGVYEPYIELQNTFAALYNGRVKTRLTQSEIRGYETPVHAALDADNIPVSVYENLISTIDKYKNVLHRWAALKKKVLGVKELHPYDSYASLFPGVQKEYTYDEAVKMVTEALKPLGEEYVKVMVHGFENRWIDVYETQNKRSGAYSNSTGCGPHPFILLNWNNTLDDVFTLAHEVGHNMHSYFSEQNQPFQYAGYSIFVAEVASITNEALLLDYLIEHAETVEEKMALYEKFLVGAQSTFFRQARFAEFEKEVHDIAVKEGKILSADELTKLFADMYSRYWGPDMVVDEEEGHSWARIPHLFKYNFYVYQYATGFVAAQALSERIKKEGAPAIKDYLGYLSSGESDYAINVLKKAGVDMSKPEPVKATLDKIDRYITELEKLIEENK